MPVFISINHHGIPSIAVVKGKINSVPRLNESVDSTLILGLRLTFGNIVIDGSLDYKTQEILKHDKAANR